MPGSEKQPSGSQGCGSRKGAVWRRDEPRQCVEVRSSLRVPRVADRGSVLFGAETKAAIARRRTATPRLCDRCCDCQKSGLQCVQELIDASRIDLHYHLSHIRFARIVIILKHKASSSSFLAIVVVLVFAGRATRSSTGPCPAQSGCPEHDDWSAPCLISMPSTTSKT